MPDGLLTVFVVDNNTNRPVPDATVNVYSIPDESSSSPTSVYQNLKTDISGQVIGLNLLAPDVELSLTPNPSARPYSEYVVEVIKDGYETIIINGTQIFATVEARQPIQLVPKARSPLLYTRQNELVFNIEAITLWGNYPPKIPEDDLKPLPPPTGFVVLDNPVVPEFVVVHDGLPEDKSAQNYWITYKDYIKNVASSEIYSTWPTQTIYANVLAIVSFTLNRVFTEWYRNQGYNYTITSTTAYDHKFINKRNVFDTISVAVDEIFSTFIKRPPSARQPLLAQYCDGEKSQCPGQMTQWGSKELGAQGQTYEQIIKHFYGNDLVLAQAPIVTGVPVSYPGESLQLGSTGSDVRTIQNQLNAISGGYPALPKVRENGTFDAATQTSVKEFQRIFGLPQSGVVDFKTWYEISRVYTAVTKIAELRYR
ncbi:MAG TPA: peptidoglycan-binding protein [Peptostreptococcaceae bacterium]|nr:peptidoglycan-binding protein [Peptostreptococcaceae bacterium]